MNPETQKTLRAAEDAVSRLVECCCKTGPLYQSSPKTVAQVNRTAKWLLNALAALRRELPPPADQPQP